MVPRWVPLVLLLALVLLLVFPGGTAACPTCKDGMAHHDPAAMNMARGYFWSILFMMSMPFLILGGLSAYFYLEIRRARQRHETGHEPVSPYDASSDLDPRSGAGGGPAGDQALRLVGAGVDGERGPGLH